MNRIEFSGLVLICLGVVFYTLRKGSPAVAEFKRPVVAIKAPTLKKASRAKPAIVLDSKPIQPTVPVYVPSKPLPPKTVTNGRYAQMHGLIGESERWVQEVFDNQYWTSVEPFKFKHTNGAQLSLT
jgi:hypothetical protein